MVRHSHSKNTHQTTSTSAVPQQETVITTTTQQAPGAIIQKNIPTTQMINKEAVITNVMEKPVLQNVIEKKEVEIHHKPVVQEIHEQKIIEIEKQNIVQNVQQNAQFSSTRAETRFEEIGNTELGEQERLRLSQLRLNQAPKVIQEQGLTQQIQEKEVVGQVIKQEIIEKHVQPVITEVREQKVVQEVVHPVVRKVYEAPIVREVQSSVAPTIVQGTQFQGTQMHSTQLQGAQFQQGSTFKREFAQQQQGGFVQTSTTTGMTQQPLLQQGGLSTTTTQKQGLGQKLSNVLHHNSGTTTTGLSQQPLQQGSLYQQPIQSGYQQTTMTEKQGLGQKLTGMLHHDKQQQGTWQQGGNWQQQQTLEQGGLRQGVSTGILNNNAQLNRGGNFQSNNALLQNQGIGGTNLTTTTTTEHWGAPNSVSTATSGDSSLNMLQHEQKVLNREQGHLTGVEGANLAQHEAVVDAVTHNPSGLQQLGNQQRFQGTQPVKKL